MADRMWKLLFPRSKKMNRFCGCCFHRNMKRLLDIMAVRLSGRHVEGLTLIVYYLDECVVAFLL